MNNNIFLEQAKKCVEQTTNEVLAEEMEADMEEGATNEYYNRF